MGDTKQPLLRQHQTTYATQAQTTSLTLDAVLGQHIPADLENGLSHDKWQWPGVVGADANEAMRSITEVYGSALNVQLSIEGGMQAIALNNKQLIILANSDGKVTTTPHVDHIENLRQMKTLKLQASVASAAKKNCCVM